MKVVAIIPARYGSTRFPGKPLAMIGDKPMIQHVYESVGKAEGIDEIWVATDDERIQDAVLEFGGCAMMTSPKHKCGTDRCAEAARVLKLKPKDIVINVQGDMPFIKPSSIITLVRSLQRECDLATLVTDCHKEDYKNPNHVKIAMGHYSVAVACKFSRKRIYNHMNYKHIGVYGYTMGVLQMLAYITTPMSKSNLEQERWMGEGFIVRCKHVDDDTISVDTPEDLQKAIEYYETR